VLTLFPRPTLVPELESHLCSFFQALQSFAGFYLTRALLISLCNASFWSETDIILELSTLRKPHFLITKHSLAHTSFLHAPSLILRGDPQMRCHLFYSHQLLIKGEVSDPKTPLNKLFSVTSELHTCLTILHIPSFRHFPSAKRLRNGRLALKSCSLLSLYLPLFFL
jgi:hypothetical protein